MRRSLTDKTSGRAGFKHCAHPLLLALPLCLAAAPIFAQTADLQVQRFTPEPGGGLNFNQVEGAGTPGHLTPSFGLYLNYAHRPLVLAGTDGTVDALRYDLGADLLAAIGLGSRFQLGLAFPITLLQQAGSSDLVALPQVAKQAPGDLRIEPKVKLVGGEGFRLALAVPLSLPTGAEAAYHGEASFTVEPRLIAELAAGERLRLGVNAGYLVRTSQTFLGLVTGNELRFGAAGELALSPERVSILAEIFGSAAPGNTSTAAETLGLEANLGLRFRSGGGHSITLSAGPGITVGYGTPTFRGLLGYAYTPTHKAAPSDRDGDGLVDNLDQCPDEPEDKDSFQDEDGCPDLDNDKDGIADTADRCPDEAEDKDGFEDSDGCPDPDNDKDGIADAADTCPNEPEDKDGFEDADGCPDPDNDKDGIADTSDRCPNEPESKNGFQDEDGCADTKPEVKIVRREMVLEKVFFDVDTANLTERSKEVLQAAAAVLKEHAEITLLKIGGHTDSTSTPKHNLDLSKRRAAAVMSYLIEQGVEAKRLKSEGYGQTRPIAPNTTDEGREKNRRVEFTILERDGRPAH